jgi:hypothetical protein
MLNSPHKAEVPLLTSRRVLPRAKGLKIFKLPIGSGVCIFAADFDGLFFLCKGVNSHYRLND